MGVRGIKELLKIVNWLPSNNFGGDSESDVQVDNDTTTNDTEAEDPAGTTPSSSCCGCTTSLWNNKASMDVSNNSTSSLFQVGPSNNNIKASSSSLYQKLLPQSTFLIDGNGLAFYLHSIAYTTYTRSLYNKNESGGSNGLTMPNSSSSPSSSCPTIQSILQQQKDLNTPIISEYLPNMMPLSYLRQVTREFVTTLLRHNIQIEVYWDGPLRRYKQQTDAERTKYRQEQVSNLQMYCQYNVLPTTKYRNQKNKFVCEWKNDFPFSKLFLTVVRHTIQQLENIHNVRMINCQEEADIELAMRATGNINMYVIGYDSDFLFYRDIQYIPFNEISIQSNALYAMVMKRSTLATKLGLDDTRMVDLAMMMGNDYIIDPITALNLPQELVLQSSSSKKNKKISVQSVIYYLQCHEDFQVTAKDKASQKAIDYVQSLYNLHDLEKYTPAIDDETTDEEVVDENIEDRQHNGIQLHPEDTSLKGVIIRCIQTRIGQTSTEDAFKYLQTALDVYIEFTEQQHPETTSNKIQQQQQQHLLEKPTLDEMKIVTFIETLIARLYRALSSSNNSLLIKMTQPDSMMNRIQLHNMLISQRSQSTTNDNTLSLPSPEDTSNVENHITPLQVQLPIDEHEEAILENIQKHRVTIIHGETGCGKSSRVPVMLLKAPPPDGSLRKVKFFISQPRRIAAKALVERVRQCEPTLKDKFALRMGHGWKEYENKNTQVHFVTTGYLVRLLANHPEKFNNCTHLVIDEVHERSVDTDILCLLCRRLLESNKEIRLILMSATLATKMYREYFNVPNEPIHVGVRRYPITEYFIEDLQHFGLPNSEAAASFAIQKEVEEKRCREAPTSKGMIKRFALTARLATMVGKVGASVLIFVPGMAEIVAISECIESFHVAGIRYSTYPIHSDIPFEEQMGAFDPPAEDEVKVIIATNAAESSVTLPNVDHVICLGLCRQIVYNQASHRQILMPTWISQASATQRAGRTGRIRPGNVYRLYTRHAYENYMEEFEPGEMLRIPLDSVILMLKQILHEEVKPVFCECLEPPPLDTIDRSFQSLHYWNFITEASDKADITSLGSFVSSLGIDLSLGSFIGLGIQFGVAAEAIEMAAMMSLPKTPFQISSPMWLTTKKYNETASRTYMSKCKFDSELYSEPLALMNALWEFSETRKENSWCIKNRIAIKRWQQVVSSRNSLRKRVADFFGVNEHHLQVKLPPKHMPYEKLLILRLLKVWVFSNSIIECAPSSLEYSPDGSVSVSIKGKSSTKITQSQLDSILDPSRHQYRIVEYIESEETGVFEEEGGFDLHAFLPDFECRLMSYACEKDIEAIVCQSHEEFVLYLNNKSAVKRSIRKYLHTIDDFVLQQQYFAYLYADKKRRGNLERSAGLWTVQNSSQEEGLVTSRKQFCKFHLSKASSSDFERIWGCMMHELYVSDVKAMMAWSFPSQGGKNQKKKKSSSSQPFKVLSRGQCKKISKQDMQDLLGRQSSTISSNDKQPSQSIIFQKDRKKDASDFPLFVDVPEGVRILAVLASGHRKSKNILRFPSTFQSDAELNNSEDTIDFTIKEDEMDVSKRWRRLNSASVVYVDESVPATAIHTNSDLWAVASNALELQRGGLKVEALTLLPPNPLFILLAFLSFGLEFDATVSWITGADNQTKGIDKKVSNAYTWLTGKTKSFKTDDESRIILTKPVIKNGHATAIILDESQIKEKILEAISFHESSMDMGERLECFPEKIKHLCNLFNSIDGHEMALWDSLQKEALSSQNLTAWQRERKISVKEENKLSLLNGKHPLPENVSLSPPRKDTKKENLTKNGVYKNGEKMEHHPIRHFDKHILKLSKQWFATTLNNGETVPDFPSTNILALLCEAFGHQIILNNGLKTSNASKYKVSLDTKNWDITCYKQRTGELLYKARFVNRAIPTMPILGRGKNKLPKWIKKNHQRPLTIVDANECVPPNVENKPLAIECHHDGLLFGLIHEAVQMEAAFWLELQFCHASKTITRHWYNHTLEQMTDILLKQYEEGLSQETSASPMNDETDDTTTLIQTSMISILGDL